MQVRFTPSINNKQIQNRKNYSIQQKTENKNIKEIPKYSMSEVIGRAQTISFKGLNTVEGDYVEHTCTEKSSSYGTITEQIIFNKKNGNYTHRITDKDGGLIRSEEYTPSKEKEVIITYENDIATITTKTPSSTTIEKLDSENRQIYFEYSTENTTRIEETDYTRGRKIINVTENDTVHQTVVVNLETNAVVVNGDLVIDTIYDEESGEHITKNIVTNDIHKKEKLDEKGKPIYSIEYNPVTGLIVKDRQFANEYTEDTYTGTNPNRLVSSLFISSDGKEKEIVFFDENGETIINHIRYLYEQDGRVEQEIKYNGADTVTEKIFYKKSGARTHHIYDEKTCNKKSTKEYDKTGRFVSETLYYEDGKTPKAVKEINKDGGFTIISYNGNGIETRRNHYDKNKNLLSTEIYDASTKSLEKTIQYDLKTGNKTITVYDEEYEMPMAQAVTDKEGNILSQIVFYEDGKTPKFTREYNKDRSYTEFAHNEKGKVIGSKKFNADSTLKQ